MTISCSADVFKKSLVTPFDSDNSPNKYAASLLVSTENARQPDARGTPKKLPPLLF
jgi:hypothetical protein